MCVLFQILYKAWPRMGDVESGQRIQLSGHVARHGREALGPSHHGRLWAADAPGEVAVGPSDDGEAD